MNRPTIRLAAVSLLGALFSTHSLRAETPKPEPPPPATLPELEARIVEILKETKTPGAGVALFDRERTLWSAGVGLADVASGRKASADTLFRIGSVTKSMVSLSVLMLVDEGKLSLDDRVRELAPEIWFENRWEATDPVRVVHLLEHTTGWDDLALKEYALSDPKVTLEQGLAYAPRSRTSRWRPGTRHSYCNAGPAVAARIVEKIAGKPFEQFVAERIFTPLGMSTATFFEPASGLDTATLYHGDGTTPYAFWHVLMRPAGSVSATANEMARYGRLLTGRGTLDGVTLLPAAAIERSEHPATTWAARAGLADGYGLGNYVAQADGFAWSGHDGGVEGGLARLAYLPQQGVGFALMINSGSGDALRKIAKAIRGYLVRDLPKPQLAPPHTVDALTAQRFAGWYLPDSPRQEIARFLELLLGPAKLSIDGESLVLKPILGDAERYVAVSDTLFRQLGDKESVDEPIAGLALIDDPVEGAHIQSAMQTGRRVSTAAAWARIAAGGATLLLWILAPLALLLHALLKLLRRLHDGGTPGLWLWPVVPALAAIGIVVLFALCEEDLIQRLGHLTVWSGTFFALTLLVPIGTLLGLRAASRSARPEGVVGAVGAAGASRALRLWAWTLGAANLVATVYLVLHGIVGLRTWA